MDRGILGRRLDGLQGAWIDRRGVQCHAANNASMPALA